MIPAALAKRLFDLERGAVEAEAARIVKALRDRYARVGPRYRNEADLQLYVGEALDLAGIPSDRELHLSPDDRPDFSVSIPFGLVIAIEVKIGGSNAALERQVARYASHAEVAGIVFVTTLRRLAGAVDLRVGGKPVYPVRLGAL